MQSTFDKPESGVNFKYSIQQEIKFGCGGSHIFLLFSSRFLYSLCPDVRMESRIFHVCFYLRSTMICVLVVIIQCCHGCSGAKHAEYTLNIPSKWLEYCPPRQAHIGREWCIEYPPLDFVVLWILCSTLVNFLSVRAICLIRTAFNLFTGTCFVFLTSQSSTIIAVEPQFLNRLPMEQLFLLARRGACTGVAIMRPLMCCVNPVPA